MNRRNFFLKSGLAAAGVGFTAASPWAFPKALAAPAPVLGRESFADPSHTDLFVSGHGYPRYRITSLVVTGKGSVLAITQGRQMEGGDNAQNDLVLRRSPDGGSTWEPMQVIAEDGRRALTPHCSVVDQITGRVILVFGSFPDGCHADCIEPGYLGENILRVYQVHSDDEGQTWSGMRDVTRMVRRPPPFVGGRCGSGMGIQLRHPPHAGRLIMPANNRYRRGGSEVCAVFSDDHGETWQSGGFASRENVTSGPNETQMVELADGRIMLNTRADDYRQIAFSEDGGETWSPLQQEHQLVDSSCNASIIRYSDPLDGEKSRILFSNPVSQRRRENGKVRLSYDEGRTWPVEKVIHRRQFGYSSMARLPNGDIGMLYEKDLRERGIWRSLTFARFSLGWLTDGEDKGEAPCL
jgi:sialidase-1